MAARTVGADKSRTFRINSEHLERVFLSELGTCKNDMFTSDMSIEDADRLAMRRSFLKKFKDVTHPEASARAIEGFIADNERCREFKIEPTRLFHDYVLGEIKLTLEHWLHDSDGCPATLGKLTDLSRCGPGSSVDVDLPNFYVKLFDSRLATCNPSLRPLYGAAIASNPTWARAEITRENRHGSKVVRGSNLSTVRKQFDIDRTICTEPPLEMYFQLGIGGFLEYEVLRPIGINLSTQPGKNQELACLGSVYGDFATIDLKSASNSISLALLALLPRWFAVWLKRTRSPCTILPDGTSVDLHMVASMGNGYCFPLQTMLFASVVTAVYRLLGRSTDFGSPELEGSLDPSRGFARVNAGVFGDDIVVCKDAYELVIEALELLGFEVNKEKSFNVGPFRESCGHDYFRGTNIRGVYLKTMDTRGDCYSLINRLIRWSTRTGIPLRATTSYLLNVVGFHPIPFIDGDDEGVKVPMRWWQPQQFSIATQGTPMYWGTLYRVEKLRVMSDADDSASEVRDYVFGYNADGIIISLCGGYIRDGHLSLRGDRDDGTSSRCPQVRLKTVPCWDYIPAADRLFDLRGKSWEAYADSCLAIASSRWQVG